MTRKLFPFVVSLVMAVAAVVVMVWETACTYGMDATSGTVTRSLIMRPMMGVRAVHAQPKTVADVAYDLDGKEVMAELVVWNRPLAVGDSVPILYLQAQPNRVLLNEVWALRSGTILASLAATLAIGWDTSCYRHWKARQSHPLLRD